MDKRKIGLIAVITAVSLLLSSAAVSGKEEGMPMWHRVWNILITNTDPIDVAVTNTDPFDVEVTNTEPVPVSVEGTVELSDNEVVVSEYTGDPVPVTGTVALADGTIVSIDSLSEISVKVDTNYEMVFDLEEVQPLSYSPRLYFDIDGYKTIHIWCLVSLGGSPLIDIDFSYPGIDSFRQVDSYTTTTFGTYSISAPQISFQIYNSHASSNAYVTLIFYAQGI
jgi:hypothetical protein